jgi:hypothetical protein
VARRQREAVDGRGADNAGRALAWWQKIERRQVIGKVDAEEGQGCKRQTGLCIDQRKDRERQKQVRGLYGSSKGDRKSEVG